jgi:hypothetical protein
MRLTSRSLRKSRLKSPIFIIENEPSWRTFFRNLIFTLWPEEE